MIDHQTEALLQAIVQREGRSLLSYIGDACPWGTSRDVTALATLRQLVATENKAVAALGRYLVRRHLMPPYLGSYPADFTTLNFVSLEYLVPRLVEAQRRDLAELERDASAISDAESHAEVEKLLAVKRRSLAGLEELAGHRPQPVSA